MPKKDESERPTYSQLKAQLDEILDQLQHENTDIDEAIELHKKGQEVLKRLESYLESSAKKSKKE